MNTRLVNTAAGVLHAAMEQGTRTAAGLAVALEAAQLLQSPESAAEVARMRKRVAELEAERAPKPCGRELSTGQPCPDHPRPAEPYREGPERHAYRISHDLPEYPVNRPEDQ